MKDSFQNISPRLTALLIYMITVLMVPTALTLFWVFRDDIRLVLIAAFMLCGWAFGLYWFTYRMKIVLDSELDAHGNLVMKTMWGMVVIPVTALLSVEEFPYGWQVITFRDGRDLPVSQLRQECLDALREELNQSPTPGDPT